jgi:uncharacterized protein
VTTPDFDLQATIARLFVYPVKSCAGVELPEVLLTETGLEFDRAWMVVDATGEFVSQRELPRMALIRPTMKHMEMVLRAPGMLALHIAFDRVEQPVRAKVWSDEVMAYDGFPLLVTSEASLVELNDKLVAAGHGAVTMARFRPNIVLAGIGAQDEDRVETMHIATAEGDARLQPAKPCPRCPIPDIDPATAVSAPEVGDMLRTYRANPRVDGAVTFGMNCIVLDGVEHMLKVGQSVGANYRFE